MDARIWITDFLRRMGLLTRVHSLALVPARTRPRPKERK